MVHVVQIFYKGSFEDSSIIACFGWEYWQAVFPICLNFCVELILVLRCAYTTFISLTTADPFSVKALFNDRKNIRIAIYVSWALEQLITGIAALCSLFLGERESDITGCTLISGPQIALPYW